jgi:apolipoprotein N-acyltransferase
MSPAIAAIVSFHLAFWDGRLSILVAVFLFCLFRLTFIKGSWLAMAVGTGIGLLIYVPHLAFFWGVFGFWAIPLWLTVSMWIGFYLVLGGLCLRSFGLFGLAVASPFLWTGLEYFRSELYGLRFSWLTPGLAFSNGSELPMMGSYGVYGISFMILAGASTFIIMPAVKKKSRLVLIAFLFCMLAYPAFAEWKRKPVQGPVVRVAGIELHSPSEKDVLAGLSRLVEAHPEAELLVLAEATLRGAVPDSVREWCRSHARHLVVGGRDIHPDGTFHNTAYVVDSAGNVVFQQAKSRPVQFLHDGLPAKERKLWNSPWGPVAVAICNDSAYRRALDEFAAMGARALILPTMDAVAWGTHQHELHAGIARMRAGEYRIPVLRLCGTGLSTLVKQNGIIAESTPFPGGQAMIAGTVEIGAPARVPLDRWLTMISVVMTAAIASWFASIAFVKWRIRRNVGRLRV